MLWYDQLKKDAARMASGRPMMEDPNKAITRAVELLPNVGRGENKYYNQNNYGAYPGGTVGQRGTPDVGTVGTPPPQPRPGDQVFRPVPTPVSVEARNAEDTAKANRYLEAHSSSRPLLADVPGGSIAAVPVEPTEIRALK